MDYLDIMCPEHRSDEIRENLRTIGVDLRAIAFENNAAMLTATQTNRDGAKAAVAKMTDVAEDLSKILPMWLYRSTPPRPNAWPARRGCSLQRAGTSKMVSFFG